MSEQTTKRRPRPQREPHFPRLDPERLRVFRDGSGKLRLVVAGDRCYVDARVARAFPLSLPDRYVTFLDGKDRVIGTVREPERLDEDSRQAVRRELKRRYFTPTIRRFHDAREEFGAVYCDVETDRGRRRFVARGLRDTVQELGEGELLMSDVDGNRYRIEDWRRLDLRSLRLLERLI